PEPASRDPVTARFSLADVSGIAGASVTLFDEVGPVRTVRVASPHTGRSSVQVPVRSRSGKLVMPGLYRLRLTARDAAGNVRVSRDLPFRVLRPVASKVVFGLSGVGRRVSLTFDDCNDQTAWNRILDFLASNHLHTTFFCIGGNVERYAATARRTIR